ncbi:hypothetical protein HAX54_053144 [Datura stramonium]|uniref:Uncharacterized protein n=1 Tax=Datura stramonium TaxID=4076 RepID=A0ABS8T0Q0_DATST|nr:hypothetical protein [Datura stramonium]
MRGICNSSAGRRYRFMNHCRIADSSQYTWKLRVSLVTHPVTLHYKDGICDCKGLWRTIFIQSGWRQPIGEPPIMFGDLPGRFTGGDASGLGLDPVYWFLPAARRRSVESHTPFADVLPVSLRSPYILLDIAFFSNVLSVLSNVRTILTLFCNIMSTSR